MNALLTEYLTLLARPWDLRSMGEGFRGVHAEFNTVKILTVIGIIALLSIGPLLLERLAQRNDRTKPLDSPPELFRELCRLHRLDWSSRRLLKRLAAQWGLATPALLFVEPEFFNAAKLPPDWQPEAADLSRLRRQLFDAL